MTEALRFERQHQPHYRVSRSGRVLGEVALIGGSWMAFRRDGSMVRHGEVSDWPSRREAANALNEKGTNQ